MKKILTLTEEDVYPQNIITPEDAYIAPRNTVRVVISDKSNNVALEVFTAKEGGLVYCMIGGGVEDGENILDALARESQEEAGCTLKNVQELGIIEERGIGTKEGDRFIQTNYCFVAEAEGEITQSKFTTEELNRGYHCVWLPLEEALEKLKSQSTGFMTRRTLFLLEEAKRFRNL